MRNSATLSIFADAVPSSAADGMRVRRLAAVQETAEAVIPPPCLAYPGERSDVEIVCRSKEVRDILEQVKRVAVCKVAVLVEGETGTGKELVARQIHLWSTRLARPWVRLNCAALSESLVESELFGHEKGAFTGADQSRPGRFETADGGTLLLDEISEMSVKLQAKLLRVLEEEEFERVGSTRTRPVDVRVIATTNRNLEHSIARGDFRRDLYYRLNAVHLRLPPLRERRDDIPVLAEHFLARYRHEATVPLQGFSANTLRLLSAYDWPGNVRQLRNVVQRSCIMAQGPEIQPSDLPPFEEPTSVAGPDGVGLQGKTLAEVERHLILSTLREMDGNRMATAARLGITTRTLLNKLKKYRALQAA